MSAAMAKRIQADLKAVAGLASEGIYLAPVDDSIVDLVALIIGPVDTPYVDGFYLFTIKIPDDYPLSPPKVTHQTRSGQLRINPNLYSCGKVCLSILNTWGNPDWTPCNGLASVLLSIKGMVLVDNPIRNEPCYYTTTDKSVLVPYNYYVMYNNMAVAITYVMSTLSVTPPFNLFRREILTHYVTHYTRIFINAEFFRSKLTHESGAMVSKLNAGSYGVACSVHIDTVIENINSLYDAANAELAAIAASDVGAPAGATASALAPLTDSALSSSLADATAEYSLAPEFTGLFDYPIHPTASSPGSKKKKGSGGGSAGPTGLPVPIGPIGITGSTGIMGHTGPPGPAGPAPPSSMAAAAAPPAAFVSPLVTFSDGLSDADWITLNSSLFNGINLYDGKYQIFVTGADWIFHAPELSTLNAMSPKVCACASCPIGRRCILKSCTAKVIKTICEVLQIDLRHPAEGGFKMKKKAEMIEEIIVSQNIVMKGKKGFFHEFFANKSGLI